jgi:hypothetical protein
MNLTKKVLFLHDLSISSSQLIPKFSYAFAFSGVGLFVLSYLWLLWASVHLNQERPLKDSWKMFCRGTEKRFFLFILCLPSLPLPDLVPWYLTLKFVTILCFPGSLPWFLTLNLGTRKTSWKNHCYLYLTLKASDLFVCLLK